MTTMKPKTYFYLGIKGAFSAASVMCILPALAIENPIEEGGGNQRDSGLQGLKPQEITLQGMISGKDVEKKEVAVLGVCGSSISPTLAMHLDLEDAKGLALAYVAPGSPAEQMGLQAHDVITALDGKSIGSQRELKREMRARKPGDQVKVSYINRSEKKEGNVKLGSRLLSPDALTHPPAADGLQHFQEGDRRAIERRGQVHMRELKKHLENQAGLEQNLQNLLDSVGQDIPEIQGGRGSMNLLQGAGPIDDMHPYGNVRFNSSVSITRHDDEGSITIKTIDGLKEIFVKNARGKIIYQGEYQTAEDKAAVPDDIHQRLVEMNLNNDKCDTFRMHIDGADMSLKKRIQDVAKE